MPLEDEDTRLIKELVAGYAAHFDRDAVEILDAPFAKLVPLSLRPYGRLYAY